MEQVPQKNWTMKHPALAKAFAVAFAVMSLIMAAAGFNGIGEAKEENADRLRYEKKYAERIDNYAELSKKLENSITYDELWEELEKEVEQHDKDASQHKTDLALNTAERGGYTMGADMIWEAVPDFNASRRELAIAKQMLKEQESGVEMLRGAVEQLSALEAGVQACDGLITQLSMIPHEHSWGEGIQTKAPGCSEAGIMTYKCSCGESKEEEIPAGHSWGEWVRTEPTCEQAGSQTRKCTVGSCGLEETETLPANGHTWGEWKNVTEPTCTESGNRTHTCTVGGCGLEETETLPANGHSWSDWVTTTEPTCTAEGSRQRSCGSCSSIENETIPANGHDGDGQTCTACGEPNPDYVAPASEPAPVQDEPEVNMAKKNIRVRYSAQTADPLDAILYGANELAKGIGYTSTITKDTLSTHLSGIKATYEGALKYAEQQAGMTLADMRAALKAYDDGVAAIKAGEAGLNMAWGQLENIWYELDQLEEERDELEVTRDRLNEEAARLSKEVMEADELHELENDRTSAKLLLTSVKEVKDMVNGGAEIIPSAQRYLEDYKAQTKLQYTGRLISCALAIIGGIVGLAGIPAVYEFTRKRFWLIAPVIVCAALAALAEGIYYGVGLGWWYVGMFTAIIALLHLLIVLPKEKRPGAAK